jgi:uncharacterized protein (DUF433 family)
MSRKWIDYIACNPNILKGKPRIKGTRIPVSLIIGFLNAGRTPEQIRLEFPDLKLIHIEACRDYQKEFEQSIETL